MAKPLKKKLSVPKKRKPAARSSEITIPSPKYSDVSGAYGGEKKTEDGGTQSALIQKAKRCFALAQEAETEYRLHAVDDLKFLSGDQWPQAIKAQRDQDGRPCLTINRLPQFHNQLTNEQRQNRPAVQVSPVDDYADPETAEIFQGIIRHIEYDSNADVAYDTGFFHASAHGRGYMRVITEYEGPHSFNQVIKIKRIRNPFMVYMDPSAQEPDYSDANWGFVFETLTRDEFVDQYPGTEMASLNDWASIGDRDAGWITKDSIRVAEYFWKEMVATPIVLLSNGEVQLKSASVPKGLTVKDERTAQVPKIHWVKFTAAGVIEETDWAGQWVPIIPILGDELDIDGTVILQGVIRNAKDPQRMYNYWASAETEAIALAPRAPWVIAEGQIEDAYEAMWKNANVKNYAYLPYKAKAINDQLVPPPQRNTAEPAVEAITKARLTSADDLKATTGIYDAQLGAQGQEVSGVAIQRRQAQSQTSNFHYIDNLSRAIRHLGRILIDLIPKIYDTPRVLRIIGEDGEQDLVQVNQEFTEKGVKKIYDLTVGRYDVIVSSGPSYATKRQEAVHSMLELTRSYPAIAQIAGDLMVKNMDWPGATEVADRLRKMLPPQLQEHEGDEPIPQQAQQQLQQQGMLIKQLTDQLHQASSVIETKKLELDSRERIAFAQISADLIKTEGTLNSKEALESLRQELGHIHKMYDVMQPLATAAMQPDQPQGQPQAGQ